jgi:hypothetical protein
MRGTELCRRAQEQEQEPEELCKSKYGRHRLWSCPLSVLLRQRIENTKRFHAAHADLHNTGNESRATTRYAMAQSFAKLIDQLDTLAVVPVSIQNRTWPTASRPNVLQGCSVCFQVPIPVYRVDWVAVKSHGLDPKVRGQERRAPSVQGRR